MDRQQKKRIQNRVAQRTYRNRLKQRLEDLQQQVNEHERIQAEEQQSHDHADERSSGNGDSGCSDIGGASSTSPASRLALAPGQRTNNRADHNNSPRAENAPPTWFGIPEGHQQTHPHSSALNHYLWSGQDVGTIPPTTQALAESLLESAVQQMPTPNMELFPATMPSDLMQYHSENMRPSIPTQGSVNDQNVLNHKRDLPRTSNSPSPHNPFNFMSAKCSETYWQAVAENLQSAAMSKSDPCELAAARYSLPPDHFFWKQKIPAGQLPEPRSRGDSATDGENGAPITPSPGPLAPPPPPPSSATNELEDIPSLDATVEERFEYLLACARRVGFDGFDALASQYYTMNFDHSSSIAPEQRMSRNRRLPALLAELRQRSRSWSQWERSSYQEEILKSAEEICAAECNDFRELVREKGIRESSITEMMLQDRVSEFSNPPRY